MGVGGKLYFPPTHKNVKEGKKWEGKKEGKGKEGKKKEKRK